MKKATYGGLSQVNQEVGRGSSKSIKRDRGLFDRPVHSSLSEYERSWNDKNLMPKNRAYASMKPVLMAFILCIAWIAVHEIVHCLACASEGGNARIVSLTPYPSLACDIRHDQSFAGSFLYYLSPYAAALIVLFALSGRTNAWLRLFSFAAFADTMYNLFATTVFGGRFGIRGNDLFLLVDGLEKSGSADPAGLFAITLYVAAVLILSLAVFYRDHSGVFMTSKVRRFYIKAAGFYSVFYALSLAGLFIRWPTS